MLWITISIVFFFTLLILISFYASTVNRVIKKNKKWPPRINRCPDYWEYNNGKCSPKINCVRNGRNKKCVNHPMGSSVCENKMTPYLTEGSSNNMATLAESCATCGIVWDGINNSLTM
jgi:hypothetical protein